MEEARDPLSLRPLPFLAGHTGPERCRFSGSLSVLPSLLFRCLGPSAPSARVLEPLTMMEKVGHAPWHRAPAAPGSLTIAQASRLVLAADGRQVPEHGEDRQPPAAVSPRESPAVPRALQPLLPIGSLQTSCFINARCQRGLPTDTRCLCCLGNQLCGGGGLFFLLFGYTKA